MSCHLRATGLLNIDESNDIGTGAISFVQFFNSALKLSPHLPIIFLDGGFTRAGGGRFDFTGLTGFHSEFMFDILLGVINRLELVF